MGRAVILVGLLLLAGCGAAPGAGPFTYSRTPPGLELRFWAPEGWAWGLIKLPGKPALRYGVAAPVAVSRGDVIILPGYGESAETWFETARALIDADYVVWILEGAGQGGSGRYGAEKLGEAPDFEADIKGLMAFDRLVVRPKRDHPPAVIASGTAELAALAAVERGYTPAVLILSDPLGAIPESRPWKRPDLTTIALPRQRAALSWAIANPDLRHGGPSRYWIKARGKLGRQVISPAMTGVKVPVTSLSIVKDAFPCKQLPACRETVIASHDPYPLAPDSVRGPWLKAILAALPGDHGP